MKKGFTLIELMIVIAIIGILIAVAAGFFVHVVEDINEIKPIPAIEQKQDPKPAIEQKQDPSVPVEEKKSL